MWHLYAKWLSVTSQFVWSTPTQVVTSESDVSGSLGSESPLLF